MDWTERLTRLRHDLERLSRLPTAPDFMCRYLQVAYEHMEHCSPQADKLLTAFEAVVSYELWHHRVMTKLASSQELQGSYIVLLGVEMRTALLKLTRRLERLSAFVPDEVVVRELLKAHCYYQLGETEEVVKNLEEAVEHGATHPLVFFALGYNRHRLALSEYARWEPIGQRLVVTDASSFDRTLRQALDAFRSGLSYSGREPFDAQLHFWMGIIHEMLGEPEEALAAYQRAREIDPETFTDEIARRWEHLSHRQSATPPSSQPTQPLSPELKEEKMPFPRITEEELERLRRALDEVKTVSELFHRPESEKEPNN